MALHFLQGLGVYDKYQFVPDAEEQVDETKYTQIHGWDTKIGAPDPIRAHFLHFEMHFITALTAQGACIKGGVAKTLKVQRTRLIGEGVRGFAARVKHYEQMMPTGKDFSDRQHVCILTVMLKGRGDISLADAQ